MPRPYSGGTAIVAKGRNVSVPSFREQGLHTEPRRSLSVSHIRRYVIVTDVNGIPMNTPLLLTPSSALRKLASPPTPVGAEDRTGLRQR